MDKASDFSDKSLKVLFQSYEDKQDEEEILEGEIVDRDWSDKSGEDLKKAAGFEENDLQKLIEAGEWDNLDNCHAFQKRTEEGQIMARTEAIDFRIRQLESRLPLLLNQNLTPSYIQLLKKIRALRMTKTAILALFYKNQGQRDLDNE